jgi:hypothetical protein
MHKPYAFITLIASAAGLCSGYLANHRVSSGAATASSAGNPRARSPLNGETSTNPSSQTATLRSNETLETLIVQGEEASYATLALWLLDADAADIEAYWNFRKGGKMDGDKKRLLFIHWTRLAPQAAIAAAAHTKDQGIAWWAWAANEPELALSMVGADRVKDVARGIGEFHPKWLREHFEQIPAAARSAALEGLTTWKEDEDHVATLDFFKEHGSYFPSHLFRTLAMKDPWAAYDWLQKTNQLTSSRTMDILLETMRSNHPEDLERLNAMTSPGSLKRKIEDALFSNLLTADPKAALEQARTSDTPFLKAKRLAKIGVTLLSSDPEQAFELGAEILAANPQKLAPVMQVQTDGQRRSWGSDEDETAAANFMKSLLARDPERTLGIVTAGQEAGNQTFRQLASKWAEQDLPAYLEWVHRQESPAIRNEATRYVVQQFVAQGQFREAAEWATSGKTLDHDHLQYLATEWKQRDPAGAAAWLDAAELPESVKHALGSILLHQE